MASRKTVVRWHRYVELVSCNNHRSIVNTMRKRITVLVTGVVVTVFILYYVVTSYPEYLFFNAGEPRCEFAQQLATIVSTGLLQDGPRTVFSLPPTPAPSSGVKVISESTVFYVWCGARRRPFEFRNYLSVRSVLRTLRPDVVWFYYESEPVVDAKLYHTWMQELIDDVPFFHRRSLHDAGRRLPPNACDGVGRPSVDFVHELVKSRGGTFVDEATIVVARPPDDEVTVAVDVVDKADIRLRLLKADTGISCSAALSNGSLSRSPSNVRVIKCPSDTELTDVNSTFCFHVAQSLYPKDIWTLDSDVGRHLRLAFYGRPDVVRPLPSYDRLAPNIGHVVWVGGGKMDFVFFLCVLSMLHVAKLDVVYVHGDKPPTGEYWDLVIDTRQNVQFVLRENGRQVYGQTVTSAAHVSDIWRADIMLKYGGVYLDTDAVFVRPLTDQLRAYDVVVSYDWVDWDLPFPDTLNLGVTVSKPGARFWELCLDSMKWYRDDDFSWNGLRQPYRVLERHPELAHVDSRLQVICYWWRCHPTWWPNYNDKRIHHKSPPPGVTPLDWRNDAYAFHITAPVPFALRGPKWLTKSVDIFAEIGKMILEAADMVKYFQ